MNPESAYTTFQIVDRELSIWLCSLYGHLRTCLPDEKAVLLIVFHRSALFWLHWGFPSRKLQFSFLHVWCIHIMSYNCETAHLLPRHWQMGSLSARVLLSPHRLPQNYTHTRIWHLITEALKGHRVVWKIEIYYLIRMTYEWKSMSSRWHNNIVVTHPDEIPISAKSSGWHMVVWYVYRMTYCSVQNSSGWDTARS